MQLKPLVQSCIGAQRTNLTYAFAPILNNLRQYSHSLIPPPLTYRDPITREYSSDRERRAGIYSGLWEKSASIIITRSTEGSFKTSLKAFMYAKPRPFFSFLLMRERLAYLALRLSTTLPVPS